MRNMYVKYLVRFNIDKAYGKNDFAERSKILLDIEEIILIIILIISRRNNFYINFLIRI